MDQEVDLSSVCTSGNEYVTLWKIGKQNHPRQKKIGDGREERAALRCLESVSSSRTTSLTIDNSVRRSAIRVGARVNGNNILARFAGWKP
jgi:hypothetical protein